MREEFLLISHIFIFVPRTPDYIDSRHPIQGQQTAPNIRSEIR